VLFRCCLGALLSVLLVSQWASPALAAEAFDWDPRIVRGQLENGFAYYLVRVPQAKAQVSMQLMVRVGSLDEREDQSGVAHMVEHMVFHASRRHPEGLHAYFQQNDFTVGRHYNAQTNFERTLYMVGLDNRPARAAIALEALAEIAGGALIPADGLASERAVILEEWRMKLGVRERMEQQRRALLRAGSLYPVRPTIGSEASIRTQSAQALRDFYADWYRPGNMALIVAGDIDPEVLVPRIREKFGHLQPAPLPPRNPRDPRLSEGLRIARMQDAESGSSQVGWVFRFESNPHQDQTGLRERLIDRLAERLIRAQVRRQAEALPVTMDSLTSSKGDLGGRVESLGFAATVAPDGHGEGLRQILLAQARLLRAPIDETVLAGEIAEIRRLNASGVETGERRELANWLQLLGEALTADRVLQDPRQKQQQIDAILPTLTADAVQTRIRQWLSSTDQLLFMIAPGLSPLRLPTLAEVESLKSEMAASPLPPLPVSNADLDKVAPDLPGFASAGEIVEETQALEGSVIRWRLANGDQFVWLREGKAPLQFAVRSGAGFRLPGAPAWEWQVAAQMARDSDLAAQAAGDLARWQGVRKLSLSQEQTETRLSWLARVQADQLEDLFRLYAARQMGTRLSADALAPVLRQLSRQAARRTGSVSERAATAMSELRFGSDDGVQPVPAQLKSFAGPAGVETMQARWQTLVAQPVTYFLMGEADPEALRTLVERHLAGVPRAEPALVSEASKPLPGARGRTLNIGIEPQASVRAQFAQPLGWTPEDAMGVALLSRVIHRSLRTELREKQSGIYRLSFNLSLEPERGLVLGELHFTADPARIRELWSKTRAILAAPAAHLDTRVLLEEIRQMQQQERARQQDPATRFQRLQLSYAQWGDARYLDASRDLGEAMTPAFLQALAERLQLTQSMKHVLLLPAGEGA
jgi:zinc protease